MTLPAVACDVAGAIASTCVHASPGAPTVQQWSGQVHHAGKDLITSYLALGPLYWLALFAALWLLKKTLSFVAFMFIRPRKDHP